MRIYFLLERLFIITSFVIAEIASFRGYSRHISLGRPRCVNVESLLIASTHTFTLSCSRLNEMNEITTSEFLQAEKKYFSEFYEDNVSCGSSMSLDVLLMSRKIEMMLNEKVLTIDEVSDVWISLWGCNCKCLTEEEAFETIGAIYDLNKVHTG